jgi:hypothetical protein
MWAVLAVFVGGLLLWSGLNLLHAEPPGALWTPADLPDLPADEHNGWEVVRDHSDVIRKVPLRPVDAAVRFWMAADTAVERPTPEGLALAEQSFARQDVAAAWTACEEALATPAFVDGCDFDSAGRCPSLELAQCQRLTSFTLLRGVAAGQWATVGVGLDRLVAQGEGHLASARSLVGLLLALRNTSETMKLGTQLWSWARSDGATESLDAARRRAVAFEPEGVDASVAVIGEYLQALRGAVRIDRGEANAGELGMPGFFFDAGATIGELNRVFQGAGGIAGAASRPQAPLQPYAQGLGWWVRNPLGKLYLDAVLPPGRVYDSLATERSRLVEAHAAFCATAAVH